MLFIILKIAALLGVIIIPLIPRKRKKRSKPEFKINSNTADPSYAVDENGRLEKIHRTSLTDH